MYAVTTCLLGLALALQSSLACEPTPPPPITYQLCYEYTSLYTPLQCIEDGQDCPGVHIVLGSGLEKGCEEVTFSGYYRCVSKTAPTRACRPIEAGCSDNEIHQPNDETNRGGYITLRESYETMEECLALEPYIRCAPDWTNVSMTVTCVPDTITCVDGSRQAPSSRLFTTLGECNIYNPHAFMRCYSSYYNYMYCTEYDPDTLNECYEPSYTRIPSDGVYTNSDCYTETSFNLCWSESTGMECEEEGSCTDIDLEPIKLLFLTEQGCMNYRPTWARWTKFDYDLGKYLMQCRPVSEVYAVTIKPSNGIWYRWPQETLYDTSEECILADNYVQCYIEESNTFYCTEDINDCDNLLGEWNNYEGIFAIFEKFGDCMTITEFKRCLNRYTGDITCRPGMVSSCASDENLLNTVETTSSEVCLETDYGYFYCYNSTDTAERTCMKDHEGCDGSSTPLLYKGEVQLFDTYEACESHNPIWYLCTDTIAICRPAGATAPSDNSPCEDGETRVTSYYDLANCQAAADIF